MLVDLFTQTKTASARNVDPNNPWEQVASDFGFANGDELMDKVASARVYRESNMVKMANAQIHFGECMGAGYWDALTKIASADPVRDGVPVEYIKIAQASRQGISDQLIKLAGNDIGRFQQLIDALKKGGGYIADKARGAGESTMGSLRQGYGSAKQALTGNYGMTGKAGGSVAPKEGVMGKIREHVGDDAVGMFGGARGGSGSPGQQMDMFSQGTSGKLQQAADKLGVSSEELGLALRSRIQAAGDAGVRLGLPAAGLAAGAGGAGYAMS